MLRITCTTIVAASLALATSSQAALMGGVDDFQDGTQQNWGASSQSITVVATGGPAGAGDQFLEYTSNGFGGPNSRMLLPMNTQPNQWQGDYLAGGVTGFTFDVANPGSADLNLWVTLGSGTATSDGSWFASNTPVSIPAGSGWTSVAYSVLADDLTSLRGADTAESLLMNVNQLRIVSSASQPQLSFGGAGSPQGEVVAATIQFDNFAAVVIPEPASVALLVVGLFACRRR